MVTNIRYICLSDTHFGDEGSLLTCLKPASSDPDPSRPSEVMVELVRCLRHLVAQNPDQTQKPTLVLNGDVLELALATEPTALMTFETFLSLVLASRGDGLFSQIVYIPGNHDHHVWETARESQYVEHITSRWVPVGDPLPPAWHTTRLSVKEGRREVVPHLLDQIIKHRLGIHDVPIAVHYPNYGVFSDDKRRGVIFSHGHLVEPLYTLMSRLRTYLVKNAAMPRLFWEIEQENFAWIDFFWSMMGRQGDAGKEVEIVYKSLQDEEQLRKLADQLAEGIAKEHDRDVKLLRPREWWNKHLAMLVLHGLLSWVGKLERKDVEVVAADEPLSREIHDGLVLYMDQPLREQIMLERDEVMPEDLTFVFGHTHKPFEKDMRFDGYPEWVDVYNTGGWVIETKDPSPLHGGAVVLVDDHYDATSIHLFHDWGERGAPLVDRVEVRSSLHRAKEPNALFEHVSRLVQPDAEPWRSFSEAVGQAVRMRRQNLRDMIARASEAAE
jgi:hypothetical protein